MKTKRFDSKKILDLLLVMIIFTLFINIKVEAKTLMYLECPNVKYGKDNSSSENVNVHFVVSNSLSVGTTVLTYVEYGGSNLLPPPIPGLVKSGIFQGVYWYPLGTDGGNPNNDIKGIIQDGTCPMYLEVSYSLPSVSVLEQNVTDLNPVSIALDLGNSLNFRTYHFNFFGSINNAGSKSRYLEGYQLVYYETKNNSSKIVEVYTSNGEYGFVLNDFNIGSSLRIPNVSAGNGTWDFDEVKDEYADDSDFTGMKITDKRFVSKGENYYNLYSNGDASNLAYVPDENTIQVMKYGDSTYFSQLDNWYEENKSVIEYSNNKSKNFINNYGDLVEKTNNIASSIDKGVNVNLSDSEAKRLIELLKENSISDKDKYTLLYLLEDNTFRYTYLEQGCKKNENGISDVKLSAADFLGCSLMGKTSDSIERGNGYGQRYVYEVFLQMIDEQINNLFKSKNLEDAVSLDDKIKNYLLSFEKTAIFIKKNYSEFVDDQFDKAIEVYREKLRKRYDIEIVDDCDSLFGEKLKNKIGEYLKVVKIAVPIILISFGILDFAKALFAGDDEKMRKAQKQFLLRIVIAILFFFVPTIVNIILELANKVWNFISPNSCI